MMFLNKKRSSARRAEMLDFRASVLRANAKNAAVRMRKLKIAAAAAAVVAAAGGILLLAWLGLRDIGQCLFSRNPIFALSQTSVKITGEVLTKKHLLEYAGIDKCSNIFAFDIAVARAEIMENPRLKRVEIKRVLPGAVHIEAMERMTLARVETAGPALAVDEDGFVFGAAPPRCALPAIRGIAPDEVKIGAPLNGAAAMNSIRILKACESSVLGRIIKIEAVDIMQNGEIELALAGGGRAPIKWTEMDKETPASLRNMEKKLTQLAMSLQASAQRGKKIAWIDMRLDHNIPAIER